LTWFRLPLFIWSIYATALVMVLATPVLAITVLLLAVESAFGVGIFDPALGGDPILFQHLFWFYSHPAALWLSLYCLIQRGDCRLEFFGLGPPHVHHRPVGLCRPDLLADQLYDCCAVGDQGL
jgi:hypothetical protein